MLMSKVKTVDDIRRPSSSSSSPQRDDVARGLVSRRTSDRSVDPEPLLLGLRLTASAAGDLRVPPSPTLPAAAGAVSGVAATSAGSGTVLTTMSGLRAAAACWTSFRSLRDVRRFR